MLNGSGPFYGGSELNENGHYGNRIKVEDALSYLEQVRLQFETHSPTYTAFLDIMKDFKSQAIDTPGVITRVSQLFQGRPNLILGFNTFLPPGYEVRVNGDRITTHEPSGAMREVFIQQEEQIYDLEGEDEEEGEYEYGDEEEEEYEGEAYEEEEPEEELEQRAEVSAPIVDEEDINSLNYVETNQFNQAFSFVNKIKARFADRPTVYKRFLDILVKYYKPHDAVRFQKIVEEASGEFHDSDRHVDLQVDEDDGNGDDDDDDEMDEHVPEMAALPVATDTSSIAGEKEENPSRLAKKKEHKKTSKSAKAADANFDKEFVLQEVGKLFTAEPDLLGEFQYFLPDFQEISARMLAKVDSDMFNSSDDSEYDRDLNNFEFPKEKLSKKERRRRRFDKYLKKAGAFPSNPRKDDIARVTSANMELFDLMRSRLKHKELSEVVRSISLFSRCAITSKELIAALKKSIFNRHTEIYVKICEILGFDAYDTLEEEKVVVRPRYPRKTLASRREAEMYIQSIDDKTLACLGISYRKMLKEGPTICSGRTQLCNEVLNDEWTSYPSWISEENGNINSKKSSFDDFLYRTEDERFELDIVIDLNKYAIEALELVKRRMAKMTRGELELYRLDDKLGATSAALMSRAIRRIYGEHATRMIDALRLSPVASIDKVLDRMRLKEKEWREAQSIMNKVWREQIEKQMVRSLDHQTANIRISDVRLSKQKTLINQMEHVSLLRKQHIGRDDRLPQMIIEYPESRKVLHDVNDIVIHYVKRQTNYSKEDKRKAKYILRRLVTEWFRIEPEEMSDDDGEQEEFELGRKGFSELDLRADVEREGLLNHYIDIDSREIGGMPFGYTEDTKQFFFSQKKEHYRLVYGGDALYTFLRMHHTLCERMSKIMSAHNRVVDDYWEQRRLKVGLEERLEGAGDHLMDYEKNWGNLGSAIRAIRNIKKSPLESYDDAICTIKNFLDGQLDATSYEDNLRQLFPTDACLLFSVDKMISLLHRNLMLLAQDADECKSINFYLKYRLRHAPSAYHHSATVRRIEREYKREIEEALQKQNCYRIQVNDEECPALAIRFKDFGGDDAKDDDDAQPSTSRKKARNGASRKASSLAEQTRKEFKEWYSQFSEGNGGNYEMESSSSSRKKSKLSHRSRELELFQRDAHADASSGDDAICDDSEEK